MGATPECSIEEIPNSALMFLWKAAQLNLQQEIEALIGGEGKKREWSFLHCVAYGVDYRDLYPRGKRMGASPKLFCLYQTLVRQKSQAALAVARLVAKNSVKCASANDLKRLRREEAFGEPGVRRSVRREMAELARKGLLTLNGYSELFTRDEGPGVRVRFDGWDLIRYFLHHPDFAPSDPPLTGRELPTDGLCGIRYYASRIFDSYLRDRGESNFRREVMDRVTGDGFGRSWLKTQFVRLAEVCEGFDYCGWQLLCGDNSMVAEPLFQMRLLWCEWLAARSSATVYPPKRDSADTGLPSTLESLTESAFSQYVARRGPERFQRDVLLPLRRRRMGIEGLKRWFTTSLERANAKWESFSDDWDALMQDENGRSISLDRLFQLHLLLANMYRTDRTTGAEVQ
jgi:hypothetical protein